MIFVEMIGFFWYKKKNHAQDFFFFTIHIFHQFSENSLKGPHKPFARRRYLEPGTNSRLLHPLRLFHLELRHLLFWAGKELGAPQVPPISILRTEPNVQREAAKQL